MHDQRAPTRLCRDDIKVMPKHLSAEHRPLTHADTDARASVGIPYAAATALCPPNGWLRQPVLIVVLANLAQEVHRLNAAAALCLLGLI